jgi:hypothetical protein
MTRAELIAKLTSEHNGDTLPLNMRQRLMFWIWWYGASTEADKPNPIEPGEDYIRSKSTGNPDYFCSLDAAETLVPKGHYWFVGAGKTRPDEPLYGAQTLIGDAVVGEAETDVSAALALTIAALRDREGSH